MCFSFAFRKVRDQTRKRWSRAPRLLLPRFLVCRRLTFGFFSYFTNHKRRTLKNRACSGLSLSPWERGFSDWPRENSIWGALKSEYQGAGERPWKEFSSWWWNLLSNPGLFQSLLHIISFLLANRGVEKQIQQINFAIKKTIQLSLH